MIIYGFMAFILGIVSRISESNLNARDKRERRIGYSESAWIIGGWVLLFLGPIMIIWGIFDL